MSEVSQLSELFPDAGSFDPFSGSTGELFKKSVTTLKDGTIIAEVGGVISDESIDTERERLPSELVSYAYIKKGYGRIKYEHGVSGATDEPERFIGVIDAVKKAGGITTFDGRIIADPKKTQYALAKAVIDDMQNLEKLNAHNKNFKHQAGWSVEGAVVKSKKTGAILSASVNHVVYTAQPVNTNTFASLVKSLSLKKSLEAGGGYNLSDKIGGRALVKESIDGTPKSHISSTEGKPKMKRYANEEHAYKDLLAKGGKSEEECRAGAKQMMTQQAETDETEKGDIRKSIDTGVEVITKALKNLKKSLTFTNADGDAIEPFETENKRMAKSLQPTGEGDQRTFDVGAFMKSVGDLMVRFGGSQIELLRSNESVFNVLDVQQKLLEKSLAAQSEQRDQIASIAAENLELRKAIGLSTKGVIAANGRENVDDLDAGSDKPVQLTSRMAKTGLKFLLNKSTDAAEKQKLQSELAGVEGGVLRPARGKQIEALIKSKELTFS